MDSIPGDGLEYFKTTLSVDGSLKEALDAVVSSRTRVAAVFDGDAYLGMLTAEQISEEVVQ
jgi:predicted transcriptional regulator